MQINLTIDLQEANAILAVLGDLPTKTGAYPLVVKIKEQVEAQVTKKENDNGNA